MRKYILEFDSCEILINGMLLFVLFAWETLEAGYLPAGQTGKLVPAGID